MQILDRGAARTAVLMAAVWRKIEIATIQSAKISRITLSRIA